MAHSFSDLLVHVVFSTKQRAPMLEGEMKGRLFAYMGGIIRGMEGVVILINGPTDHVHVLARMSTKVAVADFLRELKAESSGWVHDHFPEYRDFGWQTGYAVFSVSESGREKARKYIEEQEEHHRMMTFEQEYIAMLEKHGIAYDRRFVLE